MMSFATTFIALLSLASTTLALPVPAAHQNEKRYSGVRMTYYDTSVGLGACGNLNQNSAWTVALNSAQFGGGYPSPECGKTITISYGGKTAQAIIQDACPSCPYGGLDLSPSLFQHFADLGTGVISGDWDYGSGAPAPPPPPPPAPTTTWQAPTSTWVAPTTSWTPEPSTSSTPPPPPPPTTTWTPPTTSAAPPTTSSTPPPSSSIAPSSSSVAPSSSSSSSSSSVASSSSLASSSASTSATSVAATNSQSLLAALMSTQTGTATASADAASSTGIGSGSEQDAESDGNLEMLSNVIVNLGRLVVMAA